MCGIAGILHRGPSPSNSAIGRELLTMAACLQHRGEDSAGFAVFASGRRTPRIEVTLARGAPLPEPQFVNALTEGKLSDLSPIEGGFSAAIAIGSTTCEGIAEIVDVIEHGLGGAVVTAAGSAMSIRKTVGRAELLTDAVSGLNGTHGIAHLRLATESKIDPAHAQPFWGRPFFDIAVTHNGHITNYHKLRQKFESDGYTFASANDSEVIGVYLGAKLAGGATLQQALEESVVELDGSFSFIAATSRGLGVARDFFSTKPLLLVEQDDVIALASEQQALRRLLGDDAVVQEIQPKETRTWEMA